MRMFANRAAAGRELASLLQRYGERSDVLVLGLPRGGVPVAFEVARALHAPLDVMIVRKLGAPGQPELAIGAIASGGVTVINEDLLAWFKDPEVIERAESMQRIELERREIAYRGSRPPLSAKDHVVILVDDGAATSASMLAAVRAARKLQANKVIVRMARWHCRTAYSRSSMSSWPRCMIISISTGASRQTGCCVLSIARMFPYSDTRCRDSSMSEQPSNVIVCSDPKRE